MPTILETLQAAREAALNKSLEIWERDERQDRGSCGGACLQLKLGRKLTKVAIAEGFASKDGYVNQNIADGVRSQNADIYQDSMRAFYETLKAAGYAPAIRRFWTYID